MSKLTITLDSTQISDYMTCPRYWDYNHNQLLIPTVEKRKAVMDQGTLGHLMLEKYYDGIMHNLNPSQAMEQMFAMDIDDQICAICKHRKADHIIHCIKCSAVSQDHIYEPLKNSLTKEERCIVKEKLELYVYTYSTKDFIPEALEMGFSELLYEDDEVIFILEGRIDMLALISGSSICVDHKFQSRKYNLYKKMIQFRNYCMVTGRKMMLINYVRFTKGMTDETFQRDIASFTAVEHQWWRKELIQIFMKVAITIKRLENKFGAEPNWGSCRGQYGSPCIYTPLCEEMDNNQIKLAKIQQAYTKKEEWKPW